MNDLVSIIVPIYNGAKEVGVLFDCLKSQRYKNLEFVIVDDGSTDDTLNECYRCAKDDRRFFIFHKENEGVSSARNYGIKQARGKYLSFVDVDDYIFPEYIQYLYTLIINWKADVSCCEYVKIRDVDKYVMRCGNSNAIVLHEDEALEALLHRRRVSASSWGKLYKKDIVENVSFCNRVAYYEDFFFVWDVLEHTNRVVCGDEILYLYVQKYSSAVHNMRTKEMKDTWDEFSNRFMKNRDLICRYEKAIYDKGFRIALDFLGKLPTINENIHFANELKQFIEIASKKIIRNRKSKKINRLIALGCLLSKDMIVKMIKLKYFFEMKMLK